MKIVTVTKMTCATLALGLTLILAGIGGADAKGMSSKGPSSSGMSHSSMSHSSHDRDHRHYRRYYGTEVVYASYSGCGWLKVRALETGSRYWWARYEACRGDY